MEIPGKEGRIFSLSIIISAKYKNASKKKTHLLSCFNATLGLVILLQKPEAWSISDSRTTATFLGCGGLTRSVRWPI